MKQTLAHRFQSAQTPEIRVLARSYKLVLLKTKRQKKTQPHDLRPQLLVLHVQKYTLPVPIIFPYINTSSRPQLPTRSHLNTSNKRTAWPSPIATGLNTLHHS